MRPPTRAEALESRRHIFDCFTIAYPSFEEEQMTDPKTGGEIIDLKGGKDANDCEDGDDGALGGHGEKEVSTLFRPRN